MTAAYTLQVAAGATESGKGGLIVQILRGDGQPMTNHYVSVHRQKQDISGNWVTDGKQDSTYTNNAGSAELSLDPGQYIVSIDLIGYNWGDAVDVEGLSSVPIERGQVTQLRITLGQLVVGFRYGDRKAITNQYVAIYRQKLDVTGKWVVEQRVDSGYTDNGGTVTFNLVPGYYIIRSDFTGYNWGDANDVAGVMNFAVPPGEVTPLIRDLGQLVIGLQGSNGQPLTDKYTAIYIQEKDLSGNPISGDRIDSGYTDNGGIVRFNLTPGLYVVRVGESYTYNIPLEAGKITQWDGANATVQSP